MKALVIYKLTQERCYFHKLLVADTFFQEMGLAGSGRTITRREGAECHPLFTEGPSVGAPAAWLSPAAFLSPTWHTD